MKKMPKRVDSNTYDEDAYLYLARFFPRRWSKYRPNDAFNGMEFGQDWTFEIFDKNNVATGAEFCVQNKATKTTLKSKSQHIGFQIEVSTLNYLLSLNKLVLLHFYHIPSDKGYWMWLDDFVDIHPESEWQDQETVTVNIPRKNILNNRAVKKIEFHVLEQHELNLLENRALRLSRSNPNYNFIPTRGNRSISIATRPKHGKADEVEPLSFKMRLDHQANEKLRRAFEMGEQVQFEGEIQQTGILAQLFQETEPQQSTIVAIPHTPDEKLSLQFRFIGNDDRELFNSGFIQMRLVQGGSHFKHWQGRIKDLPVTINFTQEFREKIHSTISLKANGPYEKPVVLDESFKVIEALNSALQIEICDLENRCDVINNEPTVKTRTLEQSLMRRLVAAIATVVRCTGTDIQLPNQFMSQEVFNAETIAEVLRTGVAVQPLDIQDDHVLITKMRVDEIRGMIEFIEQNRNNEEGLKMRTPSEDMHAILLGQEIFLGATEYEFRNLRLLDIEELKFSVANAQSDDEVLTISFDIDRTQIITRFLKWLPETERDNPNDEQN
jgi:hypothetical protein